MTTRYVARPCGYRIPPDLPYLGPGQKCEECGHSLMLHPGTISTIGTGTKDCLACAVEILIEQQS